MSDPTFRTVEVNGIHMHIAEQGTGPLVLLCHGLPESWYSWRHQLRALAAAGFRAVAPDMRGYGQTDQPQAIDQYTILHLLGDAVGLVDALGVEQAVIVGHDWGGPVAWHSARLRPDRFRAVIGLSSPYTARRIARPSTVMPLTADTQFYQLYFQKPSVAEAELERDPRASVRNIFYAASGEAPRGTGASLVMVPRVGGFLHGAAAPATLPAWLSEADVDFYASEFQRTGFCGGLNWYRNIDRNWELLAAFADMPVTVPALYIAGDRDVVNFPRMDEHIANLKRHVPRLAETVILSGCGHWTQQERPREVNDAMIGFLRSFA